jgi:hypothetical protein
MLDTIILLAGRAERPKLTSLLKRFNQRLAVHAAETRGDLEALAPALLRRARLIGFLTPTIVPKPILDRLGFGAYNFHPGPPSYPGWQPAYFAAYDGIKAFGVTAHAMVEKVDSGPIIDVELFKVPPNAGIVDLEKMAFLESLHLFRRLAPALATRPSPLPDLPIRWSGRKSTRKQFAAMCDIPLDISREELERRIAVFGAVPIDVYPTLTLHGHRFRLEPVPSEAAALNLVPEVAA